MIEVVIDKLVYGGKGIARHEGLTLFVPGVLPGEKVSVETKRKRKGISEADLIEVIEPSKERVVPPCKGEEECSGASWPHISYPAQLRFKEEILLETLKKIGKIEPLKVLPIIPSPDIEHYRLRVQFNVRYKESRPIIGFFRPGTHHLIEIRNGFLLHPLINKSLEAVRRIVGAYHDTPLPPLREIHMNVSPEREVLILFFFDHENPLSLAPVFDELKEEVKEVVGVITYAVRKRWEVLGRNYLNFRIDDLSFQSTEGNFFQVNWKQNKNMIKALLDISGIRGKKKVLDLYSGIGNFSLPLARNAEKVIGIESSSSSVEDAVRNVENNGISNIEFICEDVRKALKWLFEKKEKAELIVLDPPRSGATKKIIERILAFSPEKIIYISCNPATLARDLEMLRESGYFLNRLQPIDMFPHTYHIEAIAEMVRG